MIKKVLIDWGNTICAITGEYDGPMIDWPEIRLVDGVRTALEKLQQEYPLYIATNAKESTMEQINAVMEGVDCAQYFTHIFTPAEIGVGKESVDYYHWIANNLGEDPGNLLMIGDDYALDIRNAWEAGFQTALFNPESQLSQGMYFPVHQYEAAAWLELLDFLRVPRPTLEQSISWLQRESSSFSIWQHVQTVAAIVYWFAGRYRQHGFSVDAVLAHRAALLHDLDKLTPDRPANMHGAMGAAMLREAGFPETGEIVGSHVIANPEELTFTSKEAELVFFADKLVKHNQIVSVNERFDDLEKRYPQNKKFRKAVEPYMTAFQERLCADIGISADEMLSLIKANLAGWSGR